MRGNIIGNVALEALSDPDNEPIEWLFGRVLRKIAERGEHHYLFQLLAGENPRVLEQWNSWLLEFRNVLRNQEAAAKKANDELCKSPPERIGDFLAEVFAVIYLSREGYADFDAVLASGERQQASVDFTAKKDGRRVRVEVKRLRGPQDIIESVVTTRWRHCCKVDPNRFNFRLGVRHYHHGTLSDGAIARLNNAIDQLPNFAKDEYTLKLDGDIKVVLTRSKDEAGDRRVVIQSGFGPEDFEFDLSEIQSLYVKAFRVVSDSLYKFFGRQEDAEAINLIAMQWEPPSFIYDAATMPTVKQGIENAFASVGLQLNLYIFAYPPDKVRSTTTRS